MHVPVLADAAIDFLSIRGSGFYVDCTAGAGGHALRIAERIESGTLLALDRDAGAVELVRERLRPYAFAIVVHRNYGDLGKVLGELGLPPPDGVLIDAGLSSMQLDDPSRGFSFQEDGPLDMRMDTTAGQTAAEYLAAVGEEELRRVLQRYGDVPRARRLAAAIRARAHRGKMNTTTDLAEAVAEVFDFVRGVPDETRTVFQSVRIAVNDELGHLEAGVNQAVDALAPGGRLVCITFHSGEDRIVKNLFRAYSRPQKSLLPDGRVNEVVAPRLRVLTRKPLSPTPEEIRGNRRAQSAKLRAAEALASGGAPA